MVKLGCGKCAGLLVVSVLFHLHAVIAQPGFLSIDCGGQTNYTAENNIQWVTDNNYIDVDVGETAYTGDVSQQAFGSYIQYLRYFPQPLKKSCYHLPVAPNVPYLLRLWFAVGNYTGFQKSSTFAFSFSIETLGMLAVQKIPIKNLTNIDPFYYEEVLVSSGSVLYICLIRTSEDNDPFISAIELRTLRSGMYRQAMPGTMLSSEARFALGANSLIRYPQDEIDRMWYSIHPESNVAPVSSQEFISVENTQEFPPSAVMQTAWVYNGSSMEFPLSGAEGTKSLLLLYFAEIEPLNLTKTRSFSVYINNQLRSEPVTLVQNYSAIELAFSSTPDLYVAIVRAMNSTLDPMLNSFEYYGMVDTEPPTYLEDIEALDAIKSNFDRKSWISDPCYLIAWDGIGCDKSSSVIRISEINLSGMNLTGSIPQSIGRLTALVNVSLDNNQLTGPLPNFSSLTMLERLHLQNNNLSGSLPVWLSELKNLKELFVENNNFTGVIPVQLLKKPSLKLNYFGNHDLCIHMQKGKCIVSDSRKDKASIVLGTAISGGAIMVLVLMVCIAVHRKKFREKKCLNKDYSMTMPPNPSMSSAFSLKEMTKATENFSRKIGQGGFGSVFFGKLPGGKEIAVKVLSLFSKQGIHEFQNEVDLLSRVHHKNLVSLLGYCNESKELMLIYEHMSGGSLRDHLYGPKAGISELNWKTRLKIALDAAQGLEYLHLGCTPQIIHRDVKTANILLDSNLKGKLADFGLSRMAIDEEATHVTTTVKGTLGYLDPEYFRTQKLTERSDVYSFGVVLLEILCGRPPINPNLPEDEINLIQWLKPYVENESAEEIAEVIDGRLGGNYDMKSITAIGKVALRCVEAKPSSRPSVSEVVADIKEAIIHENENNAPLPNPEVIGIECGDLQCMPGCSQVDAMAWGDNSSNLPNEGR